MTKETWWHPTYSKLIILVIIIVLSVLTVNTFSIVKTITTTDSFYKDVEHPTILMKILEDNHRKTAKTLVLLGADVNAKDECGWTALMRVAVRRGTNFQEDVQDAEMLIKAGADVNVIAKTFDSFSKIPGCESVDANSDDYNESARWGRCVTLQQACYSLGKSALSLAAYSNKAELVKTFIKAGAKVDSKDDNGKTALMFAVETGAYDSVKVLLQASAKVDTKDDNGETALMFAIETGDYGLVNLLLQASADVNARNIYGQTVLMKAVKMSFEREIVKTLIKAGAEIDAKDDNGETALMFAVETGTHNTVNILLQASADINARNIYGQTVLMKAITAYNAEFKTKPKTMTSYSAEYNNTEIIKSLIKAGAKIDAKENSEETTLTFVTEAGNYEIINIPVLAEITTNSKILAHSQQYYKPSQTNRR